MYRWLIAVGTTFMLMGCDQNQQETIKEARMAELSQQEERTKVTITRDGSKTKVEDKSGKGLDSREEEETRESESAKEPSSETSVKQKPTEKEEKEEAVEKVPEENKGKEKAVEKGKSQKEEKFNHYPRGQFAVDGRPDQTVENATGIFTIEKATSLGQVKVGPINIQIEKVSLVSGEVTEPSIAGIAGDKVRFVQLDAMLQNTSELPLQFFFASTMVVINGHQLSAHDMFSGRTDGNYTSTTPKNATLVYMLNETHPGIEHIRNVTIDITSPARNIETEETIGKGKSINGSF